MYATTQTMPTLPAVDEPASSSDALRPATTSDAAIPTMPHIRMGRRPVLSCDTAPSV